MVKKNWSAYVIADILCGGAVCLAFILADWLGAVVAAAAAVFVLWWSVYFSLLKYISDNNEIIIHSGIVFRKTTHIPRGNILWVTQVSLSMGKIRGKPLLTLIRTAAGSAVIFSDYSTEC